ncbi:MAG TPA: hypothetical protein VK506_00360, partial [Conexibacter sp.]|nr:hypothetical protein [Conexibacter sp.]
VVMAAARAQRAVDWIRNAQPGEEESAEEARGSGVEGGDRLTPLQRARALGAACGAGGSRLEWEDVAAGALWLSSEQQAVMVDDLREVAKFASGMGRCVCRALGDRDGSASLVAALDAASDASAQAAERLAAACSALRGVGSGDEGANAAPSWRAGEAGRAIALASELRADAVTLDWWKLGKEVCRVDVAGLTHLVRDAWAACGLTRRIVLASEEALRWWHAGAAQEAVAAASLLAVAEERLEEAVVALAG